MSGNDAFDAPLKVCAVDGAVIVGGPRGGADVAVTPEAALLSARLLEESARLAMSGTLPPLEFD